jgi:hypothetical protein
MHMISKLWRTLCTSMGLVSQSVATSRTLVMIEKKNPLLENLLFLTFGHFQCRLFCIFPSFYAILILANNIQFHELTSKYVL